ncbi:MAG: hypothetical protein FK730_05220 [Asgard group archaeon]|nr:hypothetical protein [Asgard group archaeon]
MSAEERLYKQLEGIVSSIIKALEGLEKEFSEYIEDTNRRLEVLEDKIQKIGSLADVSGKGLVKAIDESANPEAVKGLAHLTQKPSIETKPEVIVPPTSTHNETEVRQPIPLTETTKTIQEKSIPKVPPVPTTPSIQTSIETEPVVEKPTSDEGIPQPPKSSEPIEITKDPKKEDKDELMDALKVIDDL